MTQSDRRKIGRNDPCPCGSERKYKHCHGQLRRSESPPSAERIREKLAEHEAIEVRRQSQQGYGKPIIAADFNGYKVVGVGSQLLWGHWVTVIDFLDDYIKFALGSEFYEKEFEKPLDERHPITCWYSYALQHKRNRPRDSDTGLYISGMTGALRSYYGLAYNLYLLEHDVELQRRLIHRLKDRDQFEGAHYETQVAAWLVRAGFSVECTDEEDRKKRHHDFEITSRHGDKKYSIEVKNRKAKKTNIDIGNQLYKAFRKETHNSRIVFVNLNMSQDQIGDHRERVPEIEDSIRSREKSLEIDGHPAPPAYIFVTNHPYEHDLTSEETGVFAITSGFKIPDFGGEVEFDTLTEAFKAKRKHQDVFDILKSIQDYRIPTTFDGEVPEFSFGKATRRWKIGETYDLSEIETGRTGRLFEAAVLESDQVVHLLFELDDGRVIHTRAPLSDAEIAAYKEHPETFFGRYREQGYKAEDAYDLFEWLYHAEREKPRDMLVEKLSEKYSIERLESMSHDDLLLLYCEEMTRSMVVSSENKQDGAVE